MIASTDPDYLDTKKIKQGTKQLEPVFQELADWIHKNLDTKVLNIYYDKINKDTPRLSIILEYSHDVEKFKDEIGNYDAAKQSSIADQFKQIQERNSVPGPSLFQRIFKKSRATHFATDRLYVIFTAFEPIAREEANHKIPQALIDRLKQELSSKNVWKIYREFATTTYFFYTDKQIEDYQKNGIAGLMKQQYFELLKQYDEFDYIKPDDNFLIFDSKDNFDKNFDSNWFYYSRR